METLIQTILTSGWTGIVIGIVLFAMGYHRGVSAGSRYTLDFMFESDILRVDENGNIKAGSAITD